MPKLRVYQLARELNRDNTEIIRELQHMGVPVTSHSNTVEDRLAERLRKELGVYAPEEAKPGPLPEVIEAAKVEAPPAAPEPPKPEPVVQVVAAPPPVEAKPEPKVEEKAPAPAAKVAPPPAVPPPVPVTPPPVAASPPIAPPPIAPPKVAPPKVEPPTPPAIQTTPSGGRIIPPPTRIGPAVPPRIVEPPQEQRKTMQQIVQERLQKEHRLPPTPPPGQRRPFDRPGQRPSGPTQGQPRHPSSP